MTSRVADFLYCVQTANTFVAVPSKTNRMTDAFLTRENFERCEAGFCRYMRDRYGVTLDPVNDGRTRRMLVDVMSNVLDKFIVAAPDVSLKSLNRTAFIVAREHVLKSQTGGGQLPIPPRAAASSSSSPGGVRRANVVV